MTLENSSISGNTAYGNGVTGGYGGGFYNNGGIITLLNSQITGNTATGNDFIQDGHYGGGIYDYWGSQAYSDKLSYIRYNNPDDYYDVWGYDINPITSTNLVVGPVSGYNGYTSNLTATLTDITDNNIPISGKEVDFYVNSIYVGSGTTNSSGVATYTYTLTEALGTYSQYISAVYDSESHYTGSNGVNSLTVNPIPTNLTVNPVTGYNGDIVNLQATLIDTVHGNVGLVGKTVIFSVEWC